MSLEQEKQQGKGKNEFMENKTANVNAGNATRQKARKSRSTEIVPEDTVRRIADILGESSGSARALLEFERQRAGGRKAWFERDGKMLFVVSEIGTRADSVVEL